MKALNLPSEVTLVDIKKEPLDAPLLDLLYAKTQSYKALLNTRAQKLKGVDKQQLTEANIKALLLEHYSYLKRPVLVINDQLFVGNAPATVLAAKAALHE